MIIYSEGKTTYSDGDYLSGDLGKKVRDGDKGALQKLKEFAASRDSEQPHSRKHAPCMNCRRFISTDFVKFNARLKRH